MVVSMAADSPDDPQVVEAPATVVPPDTTSTDAPVAQASDPVDATVTDAPAEPAFTDPAADTGVSDQADHTKDGVPVPAGFPVADGQALDPSDPQGVPEEINGTSPPATVDPTTVQNPVDITQTDAVNTPPEPAPGLSGTPTLSTQAPVPFSSDDVDPHAAPVDDSPAPDLSAHDVVPADEPAEPAEGVYDAQGYPVPNDPPAEGAHDAPEPDPADDPRDGFEDGAFDPPEDPPEVEPEVAASLPVTVDVAVLDDAVDLTYFACFVPKERLEDGRFVPVNYAVLGINGDTFNLSPDQIGAFKGLFDAAFLETH